MNELALFAGIGGGSLASKWLLGWRIVCYIEKAEYPVAVLRARIRDGLLDDAPIWGDARTFDGRPWRGCVDIVTAGFPCQPFSYAGKRRAANDERNAWPDTLRIVEEVGPKFVLLENVPGLLSVVSPEGTTGYFGDILRDLAACGYNARWSCINGRALGIPQDRKRLWVLAHKPELAYGYGREPKSPSRRSLAARLSTSDTEAVVAAAKYIGAGSDTGITKRLERGRAIGNAQIPLMAAAAWHLLLKGEI